MNIEEIRKMHNDYIAYECIVHGGSGANKNDGFYRDGHKYFQEFMVDGFVDLLDEIERLTKEVTHLAIESVEREKALSKLEAEVSVWAEAEQDGRLVVLPCKVGDKVFSLSWNTKHEKYEVCNGIISNARYDTIDKVIMVSDSERYYVLGKRVFFTREEAAAALERSAGE